MPELKYVGEVKKQGGKETGGHRQLFNRSFDEIKVANNSIRSFNEAWTPKCAWGPCCLKTWMVTGPAATVRISEIGWTIPSPTLLQSSNALSGKCRWNLTLQQSNAFDNRNQCYSQTQEQSNEIKGFNKVYSEIDFFQYNPRFKTFAKIAKKELRPKRWTYNSFLPTLLTAPIRCLSFFIPVLLITSNTQVIILCLMQCSRLTDEKSYENIVLHSQAVELYQINLMLLHNSENNYFFFSPL